MLCGEQFQLRLHQRKRRAQLVGGVASELPLGGKGVVQPFKHLIEGMAELAELRQYVLVDLHVCQVAHLHLLDLRGKVAQRLEGASADKIGEDAAEQRYRRRDVPVGGAEAPLRPIDNDCQILVRCYELRVKAHFAFTIDKNSATLNSVRNRVHIVHAGGTEQQIHGNTGNSDEQDAHQRDAPLQRKVLHASSPPIR